MPPQADFPGFLLWVLWTVVFTLLAVSVGHLITPLAEGSGLPQIKSILGGTPITGYFSWRVLAAKLAGTFAAQAAGLSLGKEVLPPAVCVLSRCTYSCVCVVLVVFAECLVVVSVAVAFCFMGLDGSKLRGLLHVACHSLVFGLYSIPCLCVCILGLGTARCRVPSPTSRPSRATSCGVCRTLGSSVVTTPCVDK